MSVPGAGAGAWIVSILFLAALAVAGWLLVRWVRGGQGAAGLPAGVRLLGRVPLAVNHALYLVGVGDHVLVLGVGSGVTLLERLDDAEAAAILKGRPPGAGSSGTLGAEFRPLLQEALDRMRRTGGLGRGGGDGDGTP